MKKIPGLNGEWCKHTRNCKYERRGVNKRIRQLAKLELRKES